MEFDYQARDNEGRLKSGTVEAVSETAAFELLQGHNLIVVKIIPTNEVNILQRIKLFDSVSAKEMVLFSRQLSTLINAKVPIVQALQELRNQVSSHKLQSIIHEVAAKIESGDSLSSAIARYPKVFSPLYVSMVRAGELSGTLDESLNYLANQTEKDYDLRSKVIGTMTYPIFILAALVIVGTLMFLFVLPPLIGVLTESDVPLPFTTKILIGTTHFVQNFWWLILVFAVGVGIAYRVY